MKFTKIAATAVALSTMVGSAFAADLPSRKAPMIMAPPPPVFTWSGFYFGLNAGGTFGNKNNGSLVATPLGFAPGAIALAGGATQAAIDTGLTRNLSQGSNAGAILGGQVGYNWQFGSPFLVGLEADIQGIVQSGQKTVFGSSLGVAGFPGSSVNTTVSVTKRLDYLGTVRARLGYAASPTLLIYATGGLAYGEAKSATVISGIFPGTAIFPANGRGGMDQMMVGYTVGGGIEWMFLPNWSVKAEYLYYDLGSKGYNSAFTTTSTGSVAAGTFFTSDLVRTRLRYDGHIARVGVNYHFNFLGAPASVVARY